MTEAEGSGHAARLYFEDVRAGRRFTTASHTITAEEIRAFAAQFDPQPFHLDADAARASLFGELVASGWHTAALTMRLMLDSGPHFAAGTIGLGADLSWRRPVRPGDTLHAEVEVLETVESQSRRDRGRIVMRVETCNQSGEVVQSQIARVLVPRRAPAQA
jgi:acyl dehydratase